LFFNRLACVNQLKAVVFTNIVSVSKICIGRSIFATTIPSVTLLVEALVLLLSLCKICCLVKFVFFVEMSVIALKTGDLLSNDWAPSIGIEICFQTFNGDW